LKLPFTVPQFLDVFAAYNTAIWPAQVPLYALGIAAAVVAAIGPRWGGRAVAWTLAFYWVWMGALYHLVFFRAINPVAALFGVLFIAQGALLGLAAARGWLSFGPPRGWSGIVGALLIAYALAVYPVLGSLAGHGYPRAPLFGVAPCPTTIFTFGVLLWARSRVPAVLLVIPFLWGLVGFSAALSLGIAEDFGLLVAALLATSLLAFRRRAAAASPHGAPGAQG
jgi:hypothetical protein